jgi:hypothetical protein
LQSNDEGSSAVNVNVAELLLLSAVGPDVTAAVGARVSIVQSCVIGGPVLPAASVGVTAKECGPSPSPV